MLRTPNAGRKIFEVHIYNKQVRNLVMNHKSHDFYGDMWADVQVADVEARDEHEARTLISERFPPDEGFVVQDIQSIPDLCLIQI